VSGLFVTATDTHVGKTIVTAAIAAVYQQRRPQSRCAVWKPVQTGTRIDDGQADGVRLLRGSGLVQTMAQTVSVHFDEPIAPWMAAERSGRAISFHDLVEQGHEKLRDYDAVFVEGAGGLVVPLTDRYVIKDVARALKLPLIIVARAVVGTVNHTLLTIQCAKQADIPICGVVINGVTEQGARIAEENQKMIERFGGVRVLALCPYVAAWEREVPDAAALTEWLEHSLCTDGGQWIEDAGAGESR
jgi:dethiobiotin synthetase